MAYDEKLAGRVRKLLAKRKAIYSLKCASSVIQLPGKKEKLACEMQALRIGEFLLLTIPGEPMVEYGLQIEKRIADLRSIEAWLNMNLNMVKFSIQGLEMQKAALQAMGAGARPKK